MPWELQKLLLVTLDVLNLAIMILHQSFSIMS